MGNRTSVDPHHTHQDLSVARLVLVSFLSPEDDVQFDHSDKQHASQQFVVADAGPALRAQRFQRVCPDQALGFPWCASAA